MSADSAPDGLVLREVAVDDFRAVDTVADLHMELLGFGPMAGLGWRFVRNACYAPLLESGTLRVVLAQVDGAPAGFIAFTPQSIGFHRNGLSRHWMRAGFEVLRAIVTAPQRAMKVLRALRVLLSRRAEIALGTDPLGEVVCVAVRKEFLAPAFVRRSGLRLSETLIRHASAELARAGARQMRMIVDADNRPVLMLYHLMGAKFEPYAQAGEPKVHVWFDLPDPDAASPPARTAAQGKQSGGA